MKTTQKLDYGRFAEALVERGLVQRDVLNHVLHQCQTTGALLPDLLVNDGIVPDWELSRVVCETFHLAFLPVSAYPPGQDVHSGIDPSFLRHFGLVPLDRYGTALTIAMPGLVSNEVLDALRGPRVEKILPVVGTVLSNRAWLDEHLPGAPLPRKLAPEGEGEGEEGATMSFEDESWANIFDQADEAVQLELQDLDENE